MDVHSLVRRAQGGEAAAFAELLDLHYETIYRFAWKWCGHPADAQDITQQACIKLANSLAQFRFQAEFTTWLYRLVINCAQDWRRAQSRERKWDELAAEAAAESARTEDQVYLVQVLQQLEQMGEGMKETALLVHAEGLSHAAAGAILGVSESTISWRIHTIRRRLQQRRKSVGS